MEEQAQNQRGRQAKEVINISSILDFMSCRWRWYIKWVLNREPREVNGARDFGKALHQIFEFHHKYGSMVYAIETVKNLYAENDSVLEEINKYAEVLTLWKDQYPIVKTLEVETPFEHPHPYDSSLWIRGRPDRVVVLWDKIWHVQNRGLAQNLNFDTYLELAKRHLHEGIYAWASRIKYPEMDYGGTIFNLMRKIKYRGVPTKKDPDGKILRHPKEIFFQGLVAYPQSRSTEMLEEVLWYVNEMRRVKEEATKPFGQIPKPNETINGGYYGGKIDTWFRLLEKEISLNDDKYFKDREDTYATIQDTP